MAYRRILLIHGEYDGALVVVNRSGSTAQTAHGQIIVNGREISINSTCNIVLDSISSSLGHRIFLAIGKNQVARGLDGNGVFELLGSVFRTAGANTGSGIVGMSLFSLVVTAKNFALDNVLGTIRSFSGNHRIVLILGDGNRSGMGCRIIGILIIIAFTHMPVFGMNFQVASIQTYPIQSCIKRQARKAIVKFLGMRAQSTRNIQVVGGVAIITADTANPILRKTVRQKVLCLTALCTLRAFDRMLGAVNLVLAG